MGDDHETIMVARTFPSLHFALVVLIGCSVSLADKVFPDSAVFERVSHFKDVGVPNTLHDTLNRAAIADGACRTVQPGVPGYSMWHHPDRVDQVITAITELPSTTGPSNMTLAALSPRFANDACMATSSVEVNRSFYTVPAVAGALQNWFQALLCYRCSLGDLHHWLFHPRRWRQRPTD